ncbi:MULTISPECIES: DUF1801 domain-containing protein [unclassified Rhizobium]|uniref:DUF1801 domain-containing protein n=1 Tax=unclassified Rhizobium TaxID=2613769 RepID=UPI001FF0401E|nr:MULTISPECIES: DUF1801 domain-containing protein [unclassified Rhizobium]
MADRKPGSPTNALPTQAALEPRLLSGSNPQIAKGDGDAPVQADIAAMPGWKSEVGRRIDALVVRPSPTFERRSNGIRHSMAWTATALGIHCFTKYIKVALFRGAALHPIPPGASKSKETRYLNIHQDETLDEAQFTDWVKQASRLPGESM